MYPGIDDENYFTSVHGQERANSMDISDIPALVSGSPSLGLSKESDVDRLSNVSFDISLRLDEEVYKKIMYWVNKSDFEVSGLGKITFDPETNTLKVIDAVLIEQENGSVSTEMSAAAIGKAMFLLKDAPGDLRFWWHSHVNMPVFWSGTDTSTIKQLAMGGWFVSTVFNKRREMKTAFSQSSPIRCIVDDVPTTIDTAVEAANPEWDKEYTDKVKIKEVAAFSYGPYGGYGGAYWANSEPVDATKDYSPELESRLDQLWDRVTSGQLSEEQFDFFATKIEDEYDIIEEIVEEEKTKGKWKKNRKAKGKKNKRGFFSLKAKEEEKEEDDLEEYYDSKGELQLRVKASSCKLSNIYK